MFIFCRWLLHYKENHHFGATLPVRSRPCWLEGWVTLQPVPKGSRLPVSTGLQPGTFLHTPGILFACKAAAFRIRKGISEYGRSTAFTAEPWTHSRWTLRAPCPPPTPGPLPAVGPRGRSPTSPNPQSPGRYLGGGVAAPLPGAAGLVVVPPAAAGRQLPVGVVVVEGVPQPAAVLPLPPVVLARPRWLRADRKAELSCRLPDPARRPQPPPPRSPARSRRPPCCPDLRATSPPPIPALLAGRAALPANGRRRHKPAASSPRPRACEPMATRGAGLPGSTWRPLQTINSNRPKTSRFPFKPPARGGGTAGGSAGDSRRPPLLWLFPEMTTRGTQAIHQAAFTRPGGGAAGHGPQRPWDRAPGQGPGHCPPPGRAPVPSPAPGREPLPPRAIRLRQFITVTELLKVILLIINTKSNYRGVAKNDL